MSGIDVMRRFAPKRVPIDEISAAQSRVDELRARVEVVKDRLREARKRLDERRGSLDAAAESGADLGPIAREILELEAELKAIDIEAAPITVAVERAEKILADLKEERRLATLDEKLEEVSAELEKAKLEQAEKARGLAAVTERLYGLDRLRDALLTERNGRHDTGTKALYEDGMMATFLESASGDRFPALAPEDAGSTPSWWTLKFSLRLVGPQFAMRAVKAALDQEKA